MQSRVARNTARTNGSNAKKKKRQNLSCAEWRGAQARRATRQTKKEKKKNILLQKKEKIRTWGVQNDQAHRLAQPLCQRFLIWQVSRYLQGHEQRGVVLIKKKRQKNINGKKRSAVVQGPRTARGGAVFFNAFDVVCHVRSHFNTQDFRANFRKWGFEGPERGK